MAKPLLDLFPVHPLIVEAREKVSEAIRNKNDVVRAVQAACPHDAIGHHKGRSDSLGWNAGRFVCLACGLHEDRDWRSDLFKISEDDCVPLDWDTMIARTLRPDG